MLFIGISSGHPIPQVATYAKGVKTEWAIYADIDRSFEASLLPKPISLQNIHSAVLMTPSGEFHHIGDLKAAVDKEISKAKWKMDPAEVPEPLKKAWHSLEFGQTAQAITTIKQATGAGDPKIKAAALKLEGIIKDDITKLMTAAQEKVVASQKWDGYKLYDLVTQSYRPYPEAAKAHSEMSKLESDPKIRKEKTAKLMLEKIQELANSHIKSDHEAARSALQMLQQGYGDTEAGVASRNVKVQG